jgi:hypothetical protein
MKFWGMFSHVKYILYIIDSYILYTIDKYILYTISDCNIGTAIWTPAQ